ncbi:hypothetical protein RRF57_003452 [Xylaria bambusicola]|uniref:Uncharacterized protein n=1 Tax=Xylaria bambusicola TaxID=326684 RepID=A0AAN7Z2T7_9PEZI
MLFLTADTQFSPIGVVLLGVLAQLQAACDIAVPRPAPLSPSALNISQIADSRPPAIGNATTAGSDTTLALLASERSLKTIESRAAPGEKQDDGQGKIISREAVERAAAQQRKDKDSLSSKTKGQLAAEKTKDILRASIAPPKQVSSARDSVADGEIPSRPAKKPKTAAITTKATPGKGMSAASKDKKTSKKKTKKGDAFDDLFKGLI